MFTRELDMILAAALFILAVVFFMEKGEGVLDAFQANGNWKKGLDKEQIRKYQRGCAVFCLALGLVELLMILFPGAVTGFVSVAAAIVAIIGLILYIKKITK
jgi:hypothetical protein